MNKENVIDAIDDTITNEIHLELAQAKREAKSEVVVNDDYHTMLKDLILMALPSPSQHVH
ncbi:MAG: hypothetical protein JSR17_09225 [Proteobacteria bacterium]|nr:hypothetical protein [Pseudomonadota bacterium]